MKGQWFNYLVYLSLVFLVIALFRSDYLVMPVIYDWVSLVLSFLLMFAGLYYSTESWRVTLLVGNLKVSRAHSVASMGLSVFTKYIPGKVWVILGRASYVSEKYNASKTATSSISLTSQLIVIWTGLFLGGLGLLYTGGLDHFNLGWPTLVLWIGFGLMIFTPWFNQLIKLAIQRVFKKNVEIPIIGLRKIVTILPVYLIQWIAWVVAFHLLCMAMSTGPVPWTTGLGFALAGTFGILAVIVPGGLGVREGLLAGYLILLGFDQALAVSISVASRLWFFVGEVALFGLGWWTNRVADRP